MSGITGSEARKLIEAYNAVYERNNIKEEFEKWVSELVEEGYDFSEHTWSEVADVYFNCLENYIVEAEGDILPGQGLIGPAAGAIMTGIGYAADQIRRNLPRARYPQVFRAGTHDPASGPKDRTQSAAERLKAQQPTGQQVSPTDLQKSAEDARARARAEAKMREEARRRLQQRAQQQPAQQPAQKPAQQPEQKPAQQPKPPKEPKEPNAAQKFLASKWKEFRQSVGSGGKDAQGRGITAAAGDLLGSTVRTPVRQTLDVVRKVGTPLIAPAVGVGAAWKGIADLTNPKTAAGKWIRGVREDYEIGDILINYLIEEKYAKDEKSALSIVENMSEKWAVSILEQYFES